MSIANEGNDDSFVVVEDMQVEASPTPALKLSVTPRSDVVGKDAKISTTQVCATIHACDLPDDDSTRAPVDIVVALDVSGSMYGEKLKLCKTTLELLLRQLLPHDRFGLVSFADEAVIEIPLKKLTETTKTAALDKIRGLKTRGCTNISGAIGIAAQEMGTIDNPNDVRSIFLLTDGLANRGISHASGIVEVTKGCLTQTKDDGSPPITIHCFGYGTDHDEKLLTDVSEATTGGSYYFVESDSNVATAFGDALGGILSVVAQNAVVNISVPPFLAAKLGVEIVAVHHERKIKRDDGSYTVTLGDFYAEESRDVLFDVKLATPEEGDNTPIPHAQVFLSYMDTIKKQLVTSDPVACNIARPPGTELSTPNHHVAVQWLRVYTAEELEAADQISQQGDLAGARARIKKCQDDIKAEEDLKSDPLINQLIVDLDRVLGGLNSRQEYAARGTKMFKQTRQAHRMQRCNESQASTNTYRGSKKARMVEKFQMG